MRKTFEDKGCASDIIELDGGYILLSGYPDFECDGRFFLISLDEAGKVRWEKTYNGVGFNLARAVDGGFAITGSKDGDLLLLKTDDQGEVQWEKTFGREDDEFGYCVEATRDGGFIVTGFTILPDTEYDLYVVKTDATGELEWEKLFSGKNCEYGIAVRQLADNSYIVVGEMSVESNCDDLYLLKLDNAGYTEWEQTALLGTSVKYAEITEDGGFIVAGDESLLKFDASGNKQWHKKYNGNLMFERVWTLPGDGFIVAGTTCQEETSDELTRCYDYKYYFMQINQAGEIIWKNKIKKLHDGPGSNFMLTNDSHCVVLDYNVINNNRFDLLKVKVKP